MIATVPSAAPSASAPTSPMKTFAGYALNQRKPSPAPAIDEQNTTISPAPGVCGNSRYLEYTALEATYANKPSALPTITVGMIARPSAPSVRLTALLAPTITQNDSAMNPKTPSGYEMFLKNGTIRSA